eukprot:g4202.t1
MSAPSRVAGWLSLVLGISISLPGLVSAETEVPRGTLEVDRDLVRVGTRSNLDWNIEYPSVIDEIVKVDPPGEGTITPKQDVKMKVRVLGVAFQSGSTLLPVAAYWSLDKGSWSNFFYGDGDDVVASKVLINKTIKKNQTVDFGSKGYAGRSWYPFYSTVSNDQHVAVLKNGSSAPSYAPAYSQTSAAAILRPYIDSSGKISIADPVVSKPITAQELKARQQQNSRLGLANLTQTSEEEHAPTPRAGKQSIIAHSEILHDGTHWTLVPKGAVLHIPERQAANVGTRPVGTLLQWRDFLAKNVAWISTHETSFSEASGERPIPEAQTEYWKKQDRVVIAVHQGALTTIAKSNENYYNFIRQTQQLSTSVTWDMPVESEGSSAAALLIEDGGSLFQLWTINTQTAADYLLDQKLVGTYLPKGTITINTQDSYNGVPRIRADQPFTVDFNVSNLLTGDDLPVAAKKVLVEHHVPASTVANMIGNLLTSVEAISGIPLTSGYISNNGTTTVKYLSTSIEASDPRKATGEEHFVMHALSDGNFAQTQIASAYMQVWPMTDGTISGIEENEALTGSPPPLTIALNDLYPDSSTEVRLFSSDNPEGTALPASVLVLDQEFPENRVLVVRDYGHLFTGNEDYTLQLLTTTPFDTLVLDEINFRVTSKSLRVNAMLVDSQLSAN